MRIRRSRPFLAAGLALSLAACDTSTKEASEGDAGRTDSGVGDGDGGPTTAGLVVSSLQGELHEPSTGGSFLLRLATPPTSDVAVPIGSSAPTQVTVSPSSLVFTPSDWSTPRLVTLTVVDDPDVDGVVPVAITIGAGASNDPAYSGLSAPAVNVQVYDDDVANVVVGAVEGHLCDHAGTKVRMPVRLASRPSADVVLPVHGPASSEVGVTPASLTFTAANWNVPQWVTVTYATGDRASDGTLDIGFGPATTNDVWYANAAFPATTLGVCDGGGADVRVRSVGGGTLATPLFTGEEGLAATFEVVLATAPSVDVTVAVGSSDATEASVAPTSLVFTTSNWSTPQTITVTGLADALTDGAIAYLVTLDASSADVRYDSLPTIELPAVNHAAPSDVAHGIPLSVYGGSTTSCSELSLTDDSTATSCIVTGPDASTVPYGELDLGRAFANPTFLVDCALGDPITTLATLEVRAATTDPWVAVSYVDATASPYVGTVRYVRVGGVPTVISAITFQMLACTDLKVVARPD